MTAGAATDAGDHQRSCALVASMLSRGRCTGAQLVTGEHRAFGSSPSRGVVHVPHPGLAPGWTRRSSRA